MEIEGWSSQRTEWEEREAGSGFDSRSPGGCREEGPFSD